MNIFPNIPMSELSFRARKIMYILNAKTFRDLLEYSERDILSISGCGQSTLKEIQTFCGKYGVKIKDHICPTCNGSGFRPFHKNISLIKGRQISSRILRKLIYE